MDSGQVEGIDMLIKDVLEINHGLFYELWNVSNNSKLTSAKNSNLIFPTKRDKDTRISEQESRVLFCNLLNASNYFYSVETPTEMVYKQKGKTHRSASSDLSLYTQTNDDFEPVLNVELKAHNVKQEYIRKDIEKLMRENIPGNWFHTLKNIDGGTLHKIFKKIADSIKDCKNNCDYKNFTILFSFCVLKQQWGCIKHFECNPSFGKFDEYVDKFFAIEYIVRNYRIIVDNNADWEIMKL